MRTLDEIIEAVQSNERPDYEELRYSVLALTYLMNDTTRWYNELLCGTVKPLMIEHLKKSNKYGNALRQTPKDFIGWNNDPENPDYQQFHSLAKRLAAKAIRGELPNQKAKQEND